MKPGTSVVLVTATDCCLYIVFFNFPDILYYYFLRKHLKKLKNSKKNIKYTIAILNIQMNKFKKSIYKVIIITGRRHGHQAGGRATRQEAWPPGRRPTTRQEAWPPGRRQSHQAGGLSPGRRHGHQAGGLSPGRRQSHQAGGLSPGRRPTTTQEARPRGRRHGHQAGGTTTRQEAWPPGRRQSHQAGGRATRQEAYHQAGGRPTTQEARPRGRRHGHQAGGIAKEAGPMRFQQKQGSVQNGNVHMGSIGMAQSDSPAPCTTNI